MIYGEKSSKSYGTQGALRVHPVVLFQVSYNTVHTALMLSSSELEIKVRDLVACGRHLCAAAIASSPAAMTSLSSSVDVTSMWHVSSHSW